MRVFGLDPGNEKSALVIFDGARVQEHYILPNQVLLDALKVQVQKRAVGDTLVIEQIASFGMPVGAEVFETVFWSGRFAETWLRAVPAFSTFDRIKRHTVKTELCHNQRAKDGHIRQALIDRFGPGKMKAIGIKGAPGPLYGLVADEWAALAVAVTWWMLHRGRPHILDEKAAAAVAQ